MAILKLILAVLLLPIRAVALVVHLTNEAHDEAVANLPIDE